MENQTVKKIGLGLGPVLFLFAFYFLQVEGLSLAGQSVLAVALWMSVWWITEAIPISATALLPVVLFPLTGALNVKDTTAAFANPMIFLFMGGFIIAVTIERWNLHRRIALNIIYRVGSDLRKIVLGFMLATGFLSMWISNTATAVMMTPIGLAVVSQLKENLRENPGIGQQLGPALMLAIAYSCSTGGMATLIGTPTNVVFAGIVEETYGVEISFVQWLAFGFPVAFLLLMLTWFYLVRVAFPLPKGALITGGREEIRKQIEDLGRMSVAEGRVLVVFALVALMWISHSFLLQKIIPGIDDTVIAMAGAVLLFLLPAGNGRERLLDWKTAESIPWGILLLFGGGLALAAGFTESGLSEWIGGQLYALKAVPYIVLLLVVVAGVNFFTEITSNVATASMILPILGAIALSIGIHPFGLMVGATFASSCAFMLPVGTPPNAVVFGSGFLTIPLMARTGFWMNIISVVLVLLLVYFLLPSLWGIDLTLFPEGFKK